MANEYFQPGSVPAPNSPGSSAVMRQEFASISAGFDKLPILAGHAGEIVAVNPTGTALVTSGALIGDYVTKDGVFTLTNKTFPYSQNFWPGFGNSVTRDAGGFAGNVLLIQNDFQLPAMDAGLLYNLPNSALGIVDIAHGGTGASTLSGAQANLGIDLKANINSPALTGTPTAPTPGLGDSSARIATTFFVTNVLNTIGAVTPGDTLPLMDGNASAGTPGSFLVSRVDHVHPSDTSRAPASAATAAGTSFTPGGGVSADNVQTAIQELDTEKAPLASPAFTGAPTSTLPPVQDTSSRIATTAWVQAELAAQPPAGMYPSNDIPLMDGVGAAGTAVEGARGDHRHPTDTTRAPLASPALTGVPTAPTAAPGTNTLQLATTAFVQAVKTAIDALLNLKVSKTSDTGSMRVPSGTTAQQPSSPQFGDTRGNTDLTIQEWWNGSAWVQLGGMSQVAAEAAFLQVDGDNAMIAPLKFDTTAHAVVKVGSANVAQFPSTCGIPFCKNKLLNGEVTRINQRGFDGNWTPKNTWNAGNTIAQQELCYGYDMWAKASATNMLQVIEAGDFRPSTVHTLSGQNVTTQQITSPASGNWVITVPQTARNVQVEEGVEATPFEIRPTGFELAQCQRYFWRGLGMSVYSFNAWAASASMGFLVQFPATMRTIPNVVLTAPGAVITNVNSAPQDAFTPLGFRYNLIATAAGSSSIVFTQATDYFSASAVI